MNQASILVVDDEPDIRQLVQEILQDEGYRVGVAENAEAARKACHVFDPDLVLLDIWMPDEDGITLLKEWKQNDVLHFPVIMMSGHGTVETAVEATRLGAYDFVEKPLSLAKLLLTVEQALAANPKTDAKSSNQSGDFIGNSHLMQALREQALKVAARDSAILIGGEPGSGKHSLARYIHQHSSRASGQWVEFLLLDPNEQRELAQLLTTPPKPGGSMYIGELSDLSLDTQAQLLKHLQSSNAQAFPGGWRVIAGMSDGLEPALQSGRLREDVYFRMSALRLRVPALRERREDLPALLNHFVNQFAQADGLPYRHFKVAAQNRLRNDDWPGNLDELKNLVQRLMVLGAGVDIELVEVEQALLEMRAEYAAASTRMSLPLDLPLREARENFERMYLQEQLRVVHGNMSELAKRTGMERTHLYRKLRSLGLEPQRERSH